MARLTKLESWPVAYPVVGRFKFLTPVPGLPTGRRTVVVRLTSDDGLVGWGQAIPSHRWSYETPETVRSTIDLYFAPALLGADIDDPAPTEKLLDELMQTRKNLVSAIPTANPDAERTRQRIVLAGDPPSPINPPVGCSFHPRCPYMQERCKAAVPPLTPGEPGRSAACIRIGEI